MKNTENLKVQIEILNSVVTMADQKKSANATIADLAFEAFIKDDKTFIVFMNLLPSEDKKLIKSAVSKANFVANRSLENSIPKEIQALAIISQYDKLKKLDKKIAEENEILLQEKRSSAIKENQALALMIPNPEDLSLFLTTNKGNDIEKDLIKQGLALMAEQENLERNAKEFLALEEKIFSLSQENLEKLNVLIQSKLTLKKKKVA